MAMTLRADKGAILSWTEMDANFKACIGLHNFLHVQDRRDSGTSGGKFDPNAWRTRTLNIILTNNISGASLVNNQVILPAGTYYVDAISQAGYGHVGGVAQRHKIRLFETLYSTLLLEGDAGYHYRSTSGTIVGTHSSLSGSFSIANPGSLELQHYSTIADSYDNGFGHASSIGLYEIYSDLKIWKVT